MSDPAKALDELEARLAGRHEDSVPRESFAAPGGFVIVQTRNEELAAEALARRSAERWRDAARARNL